MLFRKPAACEKGQIALNVGECLTWPWRPCRRWHVARRSVQPSVPGDDVRADCTRYLSKELHQRNDATSSKSRSRTRCRLAGLRSVRAGGWWLSQTSKILLWDPGCASVHVAVRENSSPQLGIGVARRNEATSLAIGQKCGSPLHWSARVPSKSSSRATGCGWSDFSELSTVSQIWSDLISNLLLFSASDLLNTFIRACC